MSTERLRGAQANLESVRYRAAGMPKGVVVGYEEVLSAAAEVQAHAAVELVDVLEQINAHLAVIAQALLSNQTAK